MNRNLFLFFSFTTITAACLQSSHDGETPARQPAALDLAEYDMVLRIQREGDPPYTKTDQIEIGLRDNYWAPGEDGPSKPWMALTALTKASRATGGWDYVLLDPDSGCPAAVGDEGSVSGGNFTTRSRYTHYLLGDLRTLGREMAYTTGEERAPAMLVALGFLAHADGFQGQNIAHLFAGTRMSRGEQTFALEFDEERPARGNTHWNIRYDFDSAGKGYPSKIAWSQNTSGSDLIKGSLVEGEMTRTHLSLLDQAFPMTCAEGAARNDPRLPTRLLMPDDVPTDAPVPPEYTMREAYEDAKLVPQIQAFLASHPDGRLAGMESTSYWVEIPVPRTVYQWDVTFASPEDNVRVTADLKRERLADSGVVAPVPSRAREPEPFGGTLPPEPIWTSVPLISFEQALEAAAQGGVIPNRAGWNEPPWDFEPQWKVEYYHPRYGRDDGADRTSFWFNARTGWLMFSAVNVAVE